MIAITDTIRINPAGKTVGARFCDVKMPRVRVSLPDYEAQDSNPYEKAKKVVKLLFPVKNVKMRGSLVLLMLRWSIAALLIWGAFSTPQAAVAVVIFSLLLMAGFATRLVAPILLGLGADAYFYSMNMVMPLPIALAIGAVLVYMTIVGAGWYSADALMRNKILRRARRKTMKNDLMLFG